MSSNSDVDIDEFFNVLKVDDHLKKDDPVVTIGNDDSADEVQIVEELKTTLVDHQCGLCCEGAFLVNKILEFGGIVTSVKRFWCDSCERSFSQRAAWNRHMELHEIPLYDRNSDSLEVNRSLNLDEALESKSQKVAVPKTKKQKQNTSKSQKQKKTAQKIQNQTKACSKTKTQKKLQCPKPVKRKSKNSLEQSFVLLDCSICHGQFTSTLQLEHHMNEHLNESDKRLTSDDNTQQNTESNGSMNYSQDSLDIIYLRDKDNTGNTDSPSHKLNTAEKDPGTFYVCPNCHRKFMWKFSFDEHKCRGSNSQHK